MLRIDCRACKQAFEAVRPDPIEGAFRVLCPSCSHSMIVRPRPGQRRRLAVIADEPREFRDFLERELRALGFEVEISEEGRAALETIRLHKPDLAILNVYLKGMLGVEISEAVRADRDLEETRIVLIGALFRANRFRANPTNLYGADEYIEEKIPSRELQTIVKRVVPSAGSPSFVVTDNQTEDAKRLARLILSDIVIYNSEKAERGIREDRFFELLESEIEEGRRYFANRLESPSGDLDSTFDETVKQFVDMKREELSQTSAT